MSSEQENFDRLRLLLKIKRYEQPPPGYFDRLPREIMARIKAGEAGSALYANEGTGASWMQRLWNLLDARPVVAGTLGVAVCGLALAGLAFNLAPETDVPAGAQMFAGNIPSETPLQPMVNVSVVGFPSIAGAAPSFVSTGGVMSLAPQVPMGHRHPFAMPVSQGF